jgi:hypothetical protein
VSPRHPYLIAVSNPPTYGHMLQAEQWAGDSPPNLPVGPWTRDPRISTTGAPLVLRPREVAADDRDLCPYWSLGSCLRVVCRRTAAVSAAAPERSFDVCRKRAARAWAVSTPRPTTFAAEQGKGSCPGTDLGDLARTAGIVNTPVPTVTGDQKQQWWGLPLTASTRSASR